MSSEGAGMYTVDDRAAGPHDAAYLFDRFADLMAESKNTQKSEA